MKDLAYVIGFWLSVPLSMLFGADLPSSIPLAIGATAMWLLCNVSVKIGLKGE